MAKMDRTERGVLSEREIADAAARPQSRDRVARIGFIGAGWWATTNHIPLLRARSDVELVSVCGLDESLNRSIQEDFGIPHGTTDFRELLSLDLDAVVVSSPHTLHALHATAALRADCHVMIEKPMATTAADAGEIIDLARARDLHVLVPYGWNYRPLTRKAKEWVDTGKLGRIEFVMCQMAVPARGLFSGTEFDTGPASYVQPNLSTWSDPQLCGGGMAQGQLTHATALLLWLTGLTPKAVFAQMRRAGAPVDLYNALSVRFDNDAIGTIAGVATVPNETKFQVDIRVFGTDGCLLFDVERERLELHTHSGEHFSHPVSEGDGAYQCDEPPHQFVELVLGLTEENFASGEVGMQAVLINDAAYRSATSHNMEET